MNDALPETCRSVREHFNDVLSSEASQRVRDEVSGHLNVCEHCSAEFQTRLKLKESLKGAVQRSQVPPFLDARVRASLEKKTERRSPWIWTPAFGAATAMVVALLFGWVATQPGQPWETAKEDQASFIESLYEQVADVMRVGLGDHLHCAYFRKFPDNPPSAEELVSKIGPQYAPLLPAIREHAPAGHQVLLAHQCVFQDRSFIHVALEDHGKLVSLVLTRRQPGESFDDAGAIPAGNASQAVMSQAKAAQFAIAGFEAGDFLGFVISDHDEQSNLRLAVSLVPSVKQALAGGRG